MIFINYLFFFRASVNQYYRYCRDICSWKLLNDDTTFLFGGPGCIIEIDESVVTKRKYNRGKRVVSKWVLGIYDKSRKFGLVRYVEKRDQKTLIPIIQKHVLRGTEIWTDEWKAYSKLKKLGYIHR